MINMPDFKLNDQVAVVTGAGAGIGKALAGTFAAAGAKVMVSVLNAAAAASVVQAIEQNGGVAASIACDITQEEDLTQLIQATVSKFGTLTLLVSNAGGGGPKPFDMPMAEFRRAFELNVFFFVSSCPTGSPRDEKSRRWRDTGYHVYGRRKQKYPHGFLRLIKSSHQPHHS